MLKARLRFIEFLARYFGDLNGQSLPTSPDGLTEVDHLIVTSREFLN